MLGGFKIPNTEILKSTLHFLVGLGSLIANIQNFQLKPLGNQSTSPLKFWSILQCKTGYSKGDIIRILGLGYYWLYFEILALLAE